MMSRSMGMILYGQQSLEVETRSLEFQDKGHVPVK